MYKFKLANSQQPNKKSKTTDKILGISLIAGGIFYGGMILQDTYDVHNNITAVVEQRTVLGNKAAYIPDVITQMHRTGFMNTQVGNTGITMTALPNTKGDGVKITLDEYAIANGKKASASSPVSAIVPVGKEQYTGQKGSAGWTSVGNKFRVHLFGRSYTRSFVDAIFASVMEW
jgi:hypothetical protein